jgi:type IV pilus assembly protein PilX
MRSLKRQQGVVLFFSMIVLLIMTIIGVALAVNATQSLRMAGAGSDRVGAMIAAKGAQDRVIALQGDSMDRLIAPIESIDPTLDVASTLTPMSLSDVDCQRTIIPTSPAFNCRRVEISSTSRFGRADLGQLTIVAGVEQEVLP